jgi:hypothetical protein
VWDETFAVGSIAQLHISAFDSGKRLLEMVSVTNNVTQEVTIIAPH